MDLFYLPSYERTPEISICGLIFAGTFSFLFTGLFSGSSLYTCFSTWPDPDPDQHPQHIMLPRPFYLAYGILFGYMFVRVTREICFNIHRKVTRLINYIKSWRVKHSTKQEEEGGGGCPICLEDVDKGSGGVMLRGCLHRFHRHCILKWLLIRPCCPTCRRFVAVANI